MHEFENKHTLCTNIYEQFISFIFPIFVHTSNIFCFMHSVLILILCSWWLLLIVIKNVGSIKFCCSIPEMVYMKATIIFLIHMHKNSMNLGSYSVNDALEHLLLNLFANHKLIKCSCRGRKTLARFQLGSVEATSCSSRGLNTI